MTAAEVLEECLPRHQGLLHVRAHAEEDGLERGAALEAVGRVVCSEGFGVLECLLLQPALRTQR